MPVWVDVECLPSLEVGVGSSGPGVEGGCELSGIRPRNKALVFSQGSTCTEMRDYLSSLKFFTFYCVGSKCLAAVLWSHI